MPAVLVCTDLCLHPSPISPVPPGSRHLLHSLPPGLVTRHAPATAITATHLAHPPPPPTALPAQVEIIANDQGNRITPSYVAFTDTERLIGDAAKNQATVNPKRTVYDVKRLIGRK